MKIPRMGRTCLVAKLFIICLLWTCHNTYSLGLYLRQLLYALMYIYSKSVHTNACINILRCFGYPREHNFGLVLILSPTGCTEGCVYFPQSCRNTHFPHFLDCLLNTTLIPCLLVCFLSILHERVQRSTKFSNRHTAHGRYEYSYNLANSRENWAQKKKKSRPGLHFRTSPLLYADEKG